MSAQPPISTPAVGPPLPRSPTMTVDKLASEERSGLLRAARRRLLQLQDELQRLETLNISYFRGPMEATRQEIESLSRAIAWLWSLPP